MTKTPIYNGRAQSDIDFAGFDALNVGNWPTGGGGGGAVQGRIVSVKDPPYNATGNGVTDDTAAIQSAINDMFTAGGGTVFFPRGVYLCNGPIGSANSILQIPTVDGATGSSLTIELLGECNPAWSVVGFPFDSMRNSTIKTTATGNPANYDALLASNYPKGIGPVAYATMSSVYVVIRNLDFIVNNDPSLYGVRLDGAGWAYVENVNVRGGGSPPTHPTTALWMPDTVNFSVNMGYNISISGFDTGIKTGELFVTDQAFVFWCKTGIELLPGSGGGAYGRMGAQGCNNIIKFTGWQQVDMTLLVEHAPSGWMVTSHDVSDPSNLGTGIIRFQAAGGDAGIGVDGGSGLTIMDCCTGDITMPTTSRVAGHGGGRVTGRLYASEFILGYTDTGLTRSGTSEVKVTNGSSGTGNLVASTIYMGTDARMVPITGGAKLQVRNPGTGLWADADQWTNP